MVASMAKQIVLDSRIEAVLDRLYAEHERQKAK
jgi:hypothetical protein